MKLGLGKLCLAAGFALNIWAVEPGPAKSAIPAGENEKALEKALATPATETGPLPLVDLLSAEKNPGRGVLEHVKGGETEKIVFGPEAQHYVVGMAFSSESLPESIEKDFRGKEVIQITLGTFGKATAGHVGQFGAITLTLAKEMKKERIIPLRISAPAEAALPESGLLLFTSPLMPLQQNDEEKLKGTFFSKSGSLTLNASSPPKTIQVTAEGRKIPFKMQAMRMEIDASLSTPFNSEEHQLRTGGAALEFPLYWADGPSGKKFARHFFEASFGGKYAVKVPEEVLTKRKILSQPETEATAAPANPRSKGRP